MAVTDPLPKNTQLAARQNEAGLNHYAQWELELAVEAFQQAARSDPANPEYHLNLARAHARGGRFDEAMRSLGDYLHNETDEQLADRYERLFSSALDEVEKKLIDGMRELEMPLPLIGKGMQMWLEYRLTVGRQPLRVREPALWAAAICLAVCKINFYDADRVEFAAVFDVNARSLKKKYDLLLETLDLIPADYRYYIGEENPLDKLFEAAQIMDEIYRTFRED